MHSGKDFNETKPEIIKCYNSTKGGVDAIKCHQKCLVAEELEGGHCAFFMEC